MAPPNSPARTIGCPVSTPTTSRVCSGPIFTAAGGQHPDWDTYDRIMAEQSRVAVLINPTRVYTNAS